MSLLRSDPAIYRRVGWRGIAAGLVVVWLLPSLLGAVLLGVFWLFGAQGMGHSAALLLMLSPLLSWLGLLIAAPFVVLAMRQGWFGWFWALVIGAATGAVVAASMDHMLALPFGAALIVALKAVLGRMYPPEAAAQG